MITLGEGNTPLIRSRRIGPKAGLRNLFFKLESVNPTGSYKDRFAAAAITHMAENGQHTCLATSSGNTGASLAAYCAAGGIRCTVVVLETAPLPKLRQMLSYGAEILRVKQFGVDPMVSEQVFGILQRLGSEPGHAMQVSAYRYSPAGMAGVEVISHELARQAPMPLDHVFCQAGGGGFALAVARGFGGKGPAVHCVQPAGNDTMAGPMRQGLDRARSVDCTSRISGLQVSNVIDGNEVIAECRPTGGTGHLVDDEEIWEAQRRLAIEEGIFCEPAAATALAGVLKARSQGELGDDAAVVALVTSTGFKDADSIERMTAKRDCPLIGVSELEERAA